MNTTFPINLFEPVDAQDYWPHRLLHIPSMTSIVKRGDDSYPLSPGSAKLFRRPKYAVLSYTWGRFEKRSSTESDPRLKIHGLDWPVPAIDSGHFTVQDFEGVFAVIRRTCDFVWVDIACIHQTDTILKMKEIGQQGKIFRRAAFPFIWLSQTSASKLSKISLKLEAVIDLTETDYGPSHLQVLDEAQIATEELLSDPWFTSLWTLQESQIQKAAKMLSSDASVVVSNPLNVLVSLGMHYKQTTERVALAKVSKLVDTAHSTGYSDTETNPNYTYSASRFRKTSLEQDRIYAIMSLYNLRLRQAHHARDPYSYPMEELEYAFAAAVCRTNSQLALGFLHTVEPPRNRNWQLMHTSRFVSGTSLGSLAGVSSQQGAVDIVASPYGFATFAGKICALADFIRPSCWAQFDFDDHFLARHPTLQQANKSDHKKWSTNEEIRIIDGETTNQLLEIFSVNRVFLLRLRRAYVWESDEQWESPCAVLLRTRTTGNQFVRVGLCFIGELPHLGNQLGNSPVYRIPWKITCGILL